MIVIVETTFIIEVVIDQDESPACEEILRLTGPSGHAHLVVPAFSLAEAGMMLERRQGERKTLIRDLTGRARNPRGSKVHARYSKALDELRSELLRVNEAEDKRFLDFTWSQIGRVETIPLTDDMTYDAINFRQAGVIAKLPDAIILASILGYIDSAPKNEKICFVTPDRAFANPRITTLLRHKCSFLGSFKAAAGWIQKYSSPSN
jgi:hypothetical protein